MNSNAFSLPSMLSTALGLLPDQHNFVHLDLSFSFHFFTLLQFQLCEWHSQVQGRCRDCLQVCQISRIFSCALVGFCVDCRLDVLRLPDMHWPDRPATLLQDEKNELKLSLFPSEIESEWKCWLTRSSRLPCLPNFVEIEWGAILEDSVVFFQHAMHLNDGVESPAVTDSVSDWLNGVWTRWPTSNSEDCVCVCVSK